MRITDLAKDDRVAERNLFVMDTENGTKAINGAQLAAGLLALAGSDVLLNLNMEDLTRATNVENGDSLILGTKDGNKALSINDSLWMILDAVAGPEMRRNTYRGKYLGSVFTDEQAKEILNGAFKGMFCGDYWIIGGNKYVIGDFDKDYSPGVATNHGLANVHTVEIIGGNSFLDGAIYSDQTSIAVPYSESKIHIEHTPMVANIITGAFGSNVKSFSSIVENACDDNYFSNSDLRLTFTCAPLVLGMYGEPLISAVHSQRDHNFYSGGFALKLPLFNLVGINKVYNYKPSGNQYIFMSSRSGKNSLYILTNNSDVGTSVCNNEALVYVPFFFLQGGAA